jgi:hypothetical protein
MGDLSPESVRPDDGVTVGKEALRERAQALQTEMAAIHKQLDKLDAAARQEGAENDPL